MSCFGAGLVFRRSTTRCRRVRHEKTRPARATFPGASTAGRGGESIVSPKHTHRNEIALRRLEQRLRRRALDSTKVTDLHDRIHASHDAFLAQNGFVGVNSEAVREAEEAWLATPEAKSHTRELKQRTDEALKNIRALESVRALLKSLPERRRVRSVQRASRRSARSRASRVARRPSRASSLRGGPIEGPPEPPRPRDWVEALLIRATGRGWDSTGVDGAS
jgi:hypothetical protein